MSNLGHKGWLGHPSAPPGTLLRDDLEVVRATGVGDVDVWHRPSPEGDSPDFLSHGNVLCVVVPVIAEVVELALELVGDKEDEGVIGGRVVVGAEECAGFSLEDIRDLAPEEWSDGGVVRLLVGHCRMKRIN